MVRIYLQRMESRFIFERETIEHMKVVQLFLSYSVSKRLCSAYYANRFGDHWFELHNYLYFRGRSLHGK